MNTGRTTKQQTMFSDPPNKDGFFITSVEENQKDNTNSNQQAENVKEEQEKPMFESIKKNSNYGTFNNNSRKLSRKKNKLVYTNGKLTQMQHSYAKLKTASHLPSVLRGNSKTSLDYLHKTGSARNFNGAQTQRSQRPLFGYRADRTNHGKCETTFIKNTFGRECIIRFS